MKKIYLFIATVASAAALGLTACVPFHKLRGRNLR